MNIAAIMIININTLYEYMRGSKRWLIVARCGYIGMAGIPGEVDATMPGKKRVVHAAGKMLRGRFFIYIENIVQLMFCHFFLFFLSLGILYYVYIVLSISSYFEFRLKPIHFVVGKPFSLRIPRAIFRRKIV